MTTKCTILFGLALITSFLSDCSLQNTENNNSDKITPSETITHSNHPDLIPVIAALHDQMHSWQGIPYQWGGTKLTGVDRSGFVWRTLKDRFNIPMGRVTTRQLIRMGKRVSPRHLLPGDLVFFRIKHELHVGFYDTGRHFLHASVSRGVMRSSLNNPYWRRVFLEARRLPKEYGRKISLIYKNKEQELAKNQSARAVSTHVHSLLHCSE
ncbi:MAG: NlpC/P60 family protein [Pantoea sp.]|uniref:C40 family peptidase n=1 Tax=Pantoea sp. TaxID=69393 RepID=UPI0039E401D0